MLIYLLYIHVVGITLTVLIELLVSWLAGFRTKHDVYIVILAQIATNPAVVLTSNLLYLYTSLNPVIFQPPLEITAVLVEWLIYKKFLHNVNRPFLLSFCANAASYLVGVAMTISGLFSLISKAIFNY